MGSASIITSEERSSSILLSTNFMAMRVVIDDNMLALTPEPKPSERIEIMRCSSGIFWKHRIAETVFAVFLLLVCAYFDKQRIAHG